MAFGPNRSAATALFVVFFLVELRGVAEAKNLTVGVASQDAVWPLRFEGNDGDVPRTSTEGGSHAATRQPLERFELEDRRRRLDVIQIQRRQQELPYRTSRRWSTMQSGRQLLRLDKPLAELVPAFCNTLEISRLSGEARRQALPTV